jgi:hypothetical protein
MEKSSGDRKPRWGFLWLTSLSVPQGAPLIAAALGFVLQPRSGVMGTVASGGGWVDTVAMQRRTGSSLVLGSVLALGMSARAVEPGAIEFNRDVRPILADHCFRCHGPDAKQRQADLRLDVESAEPKVVDPGQPDSSELIRRVTSADPDERMPPPDGGRRLTEAEVAILKGWIAGGGRWQKHWSLLAVVRPAPPEIQNAEFRIENAIDHYVQAKLAEKELSPAPEAEGAVLLRRVTLALTGLPPAIEEIEAFLADGSPDRYERVVDRLLASPRYGERMATPWLDAARYADTSGYQSDGERHMWRWRDWVIEALNANMPFDQFTTEQIAGDLLPQPTLAQRIATGFNRNHRGNAEGGIIPEEYAVEYVADRVETTATVWLGLTLGCARCHDHKYDPFTQREFYSLFAFFNNVPEQGRAIKIGNSPPFIAAPTRQQEEQLARLEKGAAESEAAFLAAEEEIGKAQRKWERRWAEAGQGPARQAGPTKAQRKRAAAAAEDWAPTGGLEVHRPLDDGASAGVIAKAAEFDGKTVISAGDVGSFGFFDKFSLAAWVRLPEGSSGGTIVSRMTDVPQGEGYQFAVVGGKLQLNLVKRWLDDALRVESAAGLSAGKWHHVAVTYDGSRVASGVQFYVDGRPASQTVLLDELNQTFGTKEPLRIGGGGGAEMRFRGAIDEVRVYRDALPAEAMQILATRESLRQILESKRKRRTAAQQLKLRTYFLEHHAPANIRALYVERAKARKELAAFREGLPTVMVMEEMEVPRPAHVLIRGQYDKPGERVSPDVPAELPPLAEGLPRNRLGLAQWLVDRANPLTSRVTVNRLWQMHFGTGLVKTAEDFGRQGEWPSHPELLDWLAAELMDGWDLKRVQRMIVSSHAFRQTSADSEFRMQNAERRMRDSENRLLARGPRVRLSAEMVRDQALFVSGLLVEQVGGPSVRPLQPARLWSELTGGEDYQPGKGAELVRRSLYTFWKRTIPPPGLATFDAPTREFCSVRESRTNTPLQALVLLNEETYVAAARALAERVMREADGDEERLARAMMLVVGRKPTEEEGRVLSAALRRYRQMAHQGASGPEEIEAMALVCSTILNLDEAVTRQ